MSKFTYLEIAAHYEQCLEKYGDCHKGVDWPNKEDALIRYGVMLDVIRANNEKTTLLDFGCGAAHMYEFMKNYSSKKFDNIEYCGLDLSPKFIDLCQKKHPEVTFYCIDMLKESEKLPAFDYIILNGVFTEKLGMNFCEMESYFQTLLSTVFGHAKKGIAFNVMSKAVDWEREDLFHLSTDRLIEFLVKRLSRNFIIRNDYGLYEYTVYVYQNN
jgi:SAM-dependent methyltransferase